jgi:hypothetical protein
VSTEYELHNLIENYFAPVAEIFYVTTQLLRGALKYADKKFNKSHVSKPPSEYFICFRSVYSFDVKN